MALNKLNAKNYRLRIKRGTTANLNSELFLAGELALDTTNNYVYIGNDDTNFTKIAVGIGNALTYEDDVLVYNGDILYV